MIRVAAVGDIHVGVDSRGSVARHFAHVSEQADVLLLAGDLTRVGTVDEAKVLADELGDVTIPIVAVLGNHDHHDGQAEAVAGIMEGAGVAVLEGTTTVLDIGGSRLGVAGTKGFGGGFAGASATEFGEAEMKAFVLHTKALADGLQSSLVDLARHGADHRVALLHYSPIEATLHGERLEIYPFLGSYLLAEAIDRAGADLVIHGHAHGGAEKGMTPAGVHVRNVAQPVLRSAYAVYCLQDEDMGLTCGGGLDAPVTAAR